jgi:hypothetical protein
LRILRGGFGLREAVANECASFVVWLSDHPIGGGSRRHCSRQHSIEENVMKLDSKSGATLAAAAATLFLAGAVVSTATPAAAAQGKCMAANACKGQSACKSASNSCKGLNACKGQGFSMASEAACKSKGGAFVKG